MNNKSLVKLSWIGFALIILLITFIFFTFAEAQTVQELDQRLKRVEDSLGINQVIIPIDTTLKLPTYQGVILSGNYDIYPSPYSPPFKDQDGYIKMFIQKAGLPFAAGSQNGRYDWTLSSTGNMPRGTVLKLNSNTYRASYHKIFWNNSYYYFAGSLNSYNWEDMSLIRNPHGEDISFIYDQGIFKAYARMDFPPAQRTIGFMKSSNFTTWSNLVEILKPDQQDKTNEFYSMSVVKGNFGYFGFMNVFDTQTDLVSVQLVWSENGEDNFKRLYNRKEYLIKKNGVKCLYACAGSIGDEIWITTISSKFSHSETDRNGRFYFTELYIISKSDLQEAQEKFQENINSPGK